MERVYVESEKGNENVACVFQSQLDEIDVTGRVVLLKPNIVDPSIAKACSDPERLEITADLLRRRGADKILLGDEPAHYIFEEAASHGRAIDFAAIFPGLGYDRISNVELIDIRLMGTTEFRARRINPVTAREENITTPVRDTRGMVLVSYALPKHHGQYNYSGVSKNLMGLVPADQRRGSFHCSFFDAALDVLRQSGCSDPTGEQVVKTAFDLAAEFAGKYADSTKTGGMDRESSPVETVYNMWLDEKLDMESMITHLEHVINAGAIAGLTEHFRKTNPQGIYVLDGSYVLTKHEHDGVPVDTDFAMAGSNAMHVDLAALAKLGINPVEVPYLFRCGYKAADILGNMGKMLYTGSLLQKESFVDSHGFEFTRIK